MTTVAFTSITDPVIGANVATASAAGTTDSNTNVVTVSVVDEAGTVAGPFTAAVALLAWTISNADLSGLAEGPLSWQATATPTIGAAAFATAAGTKASTRLYASVAQLRNFIHDTSTNDTTVLVQALLTASRGVERICGRHFYQTVETQYFSPGLNNPWILNLDDMDLATTTGLSVGVQWSNGGNYAETRTIDVDFICEPRNQSVNGIDGWPFTSLRSLAKIWPPRYVDFWMDTVKVTGTWGWAAIPDPVVQATLILASEIYKTGEAPFGVAGFGDFGVVRVRENPMVATLLQPFKKQTTLLMA